MKPLPISLPRSMRSGSRAFIAEKGIEVPIAEVNVRAGALHEEPYRSMNPFAVVPFSRARRRNLHRRVDRHLPVSRGASPEKPAHGTRCEGARDRRDVDSTGGAGRSPARGARPSQLRSSLCGPGPAGHPERVAAGSGNRPTRQGLARDPFRPAEFAPSPAARSSRTTPSPSPTSPPTSRFRWPRASGSRLPTTAPTSPAGTGRWRPARARGSSGNNSTDFLASGHQSVASRSQGRRGSGPYSLKPLRRSVDYAFSVFQSVRPAYAENHRFSALLRHLGALATNIGGVLPPARSEIPAPGGAGSLPFSPPDHSSGGRYPSGRTSASPNRNASICASREPARLAVARAETVLVDQHGLAVDPLLPRLARDVLEHSSSELAGVGAARRTRGLPGRASRQRTVRVMDGLAPHSRAGIVPRRPGQRARCPHRRRPLRPPRASAPGRPPPPRPNGAPRTPRPGSPEAGSG